MPDIQKKKKVSKKNKSSWRKHVNIKDVDDFLEDQRLDERMGYVETLPDAELFHVDLQPSTAKVEPLSEKQKRRQQLREKPARCYSLLLPHTKVPDPISKRNRVRTKEERKNLLVKKKEQERFAKGIVKAKERQSLTDKERYLAKLNVKPKKGEFNLDIWESKDAGTGLENNEWVTEVTKRHTSLNIGISKKRKGKTPEKNPTIIAPVEPPHPGLSYNPSLEDHCNLLQEVVEKEKKIMKQEEHLNRVTKGMLKKVDANEKHASWLAEMTQGLSDTVKDENAEADSGRLSVNPPVKNKKKTLKQRRKQKEQLELKKALLEAKREKRKVADIYKLRFIQKQLDRMQEKTKLLQEKRKKAAEYKKKEAKRLGAMKFEEADVDFTTGEELSGNLRSLKSKGNLLADRFKSLQKRSILQPTVRQTHKKAKVKKYVKPGHKEGWETTVAR